MIGLSSEFDERLVHHTLGICISRFGQRLQLEWEMVLTACTLSDATHVCKLPRQGDTATGELLASN